MDKEIGLKYDPRYGKSHLREKIEMSIKRQRDRVGEVKDEPVKVLNEIQLDTNRDKETLFKHLRNKFYPD